MGRATRRTRRALPMPAAITEAPRPQSTRAERIRGLYAVTPDTGDTARLVDIVLAAVRGGASVIQYRNKAADAALRREQARALKAALAETSALLIINDDVALAAEIDADGVHIGEDDPALDDARELMPAASLIGVSCYNDLARARCLVQEGADYVAFGSFFASTVKPQARRADVALLREARRLGVPVVAIGGITAENTPQLRAAGADAVAVISAVFRSDDPAVVERAARALSNAAR